VEAEPVSNNHILKGLGCGSKYQLYVTAANKIGTGLPSQIVQAQTKGNGECLLAFRRGGFVI